LFLGTFSFIWMMICLRNNCCFALWVTKVAFGVFTNFLVEELLVDCDRRNWNCVSADKPW
jgi:hypothetical protein